MTSLTSHRIAAISLIAVAVALLMAFATAVGEEYFSSRDCVPRQDTSTLWFTRFQPPSDPPALARSANVLSYLGGTLWTAALDMEAKDTALIVLTLGGLQCYNIADVTHPVLINQVQIGHATPYSQLSRDGDYLYCSGNNHLYIFGIADPFHPSLVSETILEAQIWKTLVIGNRAYVGLARDGGETGGELGFYILDVSDPAAPGIVGKYSNNAAYKDCRCFAVVNNYVYAANTWANQLEIFNISDETRPTFVGAISMRYPVDVAVQDGYLYVDKYYDTTYIYSLSSPESPSLTSVQAIPGVKMLAFHDSNLFAVSGGKVRIFTSPAPGQLVPADSASCHGAWWGMAFGGGHLFLPNATIGFEALDVSIPGSVEALAVFNYRSRDLLGMAASGNYAYVVNYMSMVGSEDVNNVNVVDISNRLNPRFVKAVYNGGNPHEATVSGSLLFVSESEPTNIYSLTNPASPIKISQYPNRSTQTKHNAARYSTLFAAAEGALRSADISNPAAPKDLASIYDEHFYILGLLLAGNLAYALANDYDYSFPYHPYLGAFDITDPRHLVFLSKILLGECEWSHPSMMAYRGANLYVANNSCGISIVDISQPALPDVVTTIGTLGEDCNDVKLRQNYLIAACGSSLQVYSLADPRHPQLVQYIGMAASPQRIVVLDTTLCVSSRWGFDLFNIDVPPTTCADANLDGAIDISDAVYLISYIFGSGEPPDSLGAGDANSDGAIDISDVVYLISYIFGGGPAPCASSK
jgi:hypothetical protein